MCRSKARGRRNVSPRAKANAGHDLPPVPGPGVQDRASQAGGPARHERGPRPAHALACLPPALAVPRTKGGEGHPSFPNGNAVHHQPRARAPPTRAPGTPGPESPGGAGGRGPRGEARATPRHAADTTPTHFVLFSPSKAQTACVTTSRRSRKCRKALALAPP